MERRTIMCNSKNKSDVIIGTSTLKREMIDHGTNSELKQILKNYYDHYTYSIMMIFSNIEFIKHTYSEADKMEQLFSIAPCFMNNAYRNAWHSIVINICSLFNKSSTSFDRFLSFVDQNRDELFTTDLSISGIPEWLYEEDDFKEDEEFEGFLKRKRGDLDSILEETRKKINSSF